MGVGGWEGQGPGNYPLSGVFDMGGAGGTANSEPFAFAHNLSYNMISLQRIMLSYAYVQFGVFRTLIDQPVKDAFKGGVRIKTDEVSEEDIERLERRLKKIKYWRKVALAMRWARLFGGAGLIVNINEDYSKKLNVEKITEANKIDLKVADRWELAYNGTFDDPTTTFQYYNLKIHPSRVIRIFGKEAPSIAAARLQGWGMSEIECILRESNASLKHENVVFELLDEAKVDIWKMKGFNSAALNKAAVGQMTQRLKIASQMKNFLNAICLDKEDDYENKQMSFSGLSEILDQIRITMASAARMPMSKIYGLSAKGFASGEDDLENYAAIVEDLRVDAHEVLDSTIPIFCMQEWGFVPDDLSFEFKPSRTLTADVQESVNSSRFARHSSLYSQGIYDAQEYCDALKRDGLLTIKTKVAEGAEPEPPMMSMQDQMAGEQAAEGGAPAKKGAKASKEKESEG